MKILVCIKQVPDMESRFKVNAEGLWYDESDLAWRMNEYDEYAVEQAVKLKEQVGDAELTVLSLGPDRVREPIKKALAMGCDRGVQIKDDESWRRDPLQVASLLAGYAKDQGYDVIFTGMQSQDRGSAQVGVLLAELLGIPSASTIVDFAFEGGTITAKRELEGGIKAVVKVKTPALFTCQLGLNVPRYPTLPNIMKAKKKELLTVEAASLPGADALIQVEKAAYPEKKGAGLVLEGEVGSLVEQVIGILKEKTTVFK
ncbi:electron transfer flavoprotein subunit beta [Desulfuromonas versatilis]|uniref:Electron transfer flavoprotein subunit beta n=1 Tax=Desulfuromonas versatilis TaxID=2802975 RepID=A0ABM8HW44_9BACT|nr:electron transfer flavoprotein subunit beta/FixA family protein [Desulfuromonas versatilis]BCR04928.1 electron transfer flavoprotein subunit beta [Desulfuromonas versatilis]